MIWNMICDGLSMCRLVKICAWLLLILLGSGTVTAQSKGYSKGGGPSTADVGLTAAQRTAVLELGKLGCSVELTQERRVLLFDSKGNAVDLRRHLTKLKDAGITRLDTGVSISDEQLQAVMELPGLLDVTLAASKLTDGGLQAVRQQQKLRRLSLQGGRKLTEKGFAHLGAVETLASLSLESVTLSEGMFAEGRFNGLKQLTLSSCRVSPAASAGLASLRKLKALVLGANNGSDGEILKHAATLPGLISLELSQTGIKGAEFDHLAKCTRLQILSINESGLLDGDFRAFRNLRDLSSLEIYNAPQLTGRGLDQLADTNLSYLSLRWMGITDDGLAKLPALQKLRSLDLPHYGDTSPYLRRENWDFWSDLQVDRITDAGLKHLGTMKNLQRLYISGGGITDEGVAYLSGMTNLESLEFGACPAIKGKTLSALATLQKLSHLGLRATDVANPNLVPVEKLKRLHSITFSPSVRAGVLEAWKRQHGISEVRHVHDGFPPAVEAALRTGDNSAAHDTVTANKLQKLLQYVDRSSSDIQAGYFRIGIVDQELQKKAASLLRELKKPKLRVVEVYGRVTPELFRAFCGQSTIEELSCDDISDITDQDLVLLLAGCTKLKRLTLKKGSKISTDGIRGLSKSSQLELLTCETLPYVGDAIASLAGLNRLTSLSLVDCKLQDTQVAKLSGLTQLTGLSLSKNSELTGKGLQFGQPWPRLTSLFLEETSTSNEHLSCVRNFPKLEIISLTGTPVSDEGMEHLQTLKALKTLWLTRTHVQGTGFKHLAGLNSLLQIDLYNNPEFTGEGLEHLAETSVVSLGLGRTGVTDAGLASIGKLEKLQSLSLPSYGIDEKARAVPPSPYLKIEFDAAGRSFWSDPHPTRLTDAGIAHLTKLKNLNSLYVSGGGISDASFVQFSQLPKLESLTLVACPKVTGTELASLKNLPNLKFLNLTGTQIPDAALEQLKGSALTTIGLPAKATANVIPYLKELPQLQTIRKSAAMSKEVEKKLKEAFPTVNLYN